MAHAADGEPAAFEELYRRHHLYARRVAERVTRNEDDARDAAAEAFTRVFGVLSSSGLRHRSSFRSYLRTTVRRVAIDKLRQRLRVQSTDQIESFDSVSPGRGPADSVVTSENERCVREAFNDLPQRSRSVLWLVDVERVPAQEAAEALGLTPNNVAQIAVRARGRLRRSYVEAHLSGAVDLGCRSTVQHLGRYLEGRLAEASVAEVDGHLSECV
ncbi:MAG: sigma-70 family RNA polymerase sigma factor, partial [Actinomycetota bacterium]|nr:sigma-70 family RNA polymerase sigma factor [Actinomycetota bacterium]